MQEQRYNDHDHGLSIAETTGLYALVIAILLIFVAPSRLVDILMNLI